MEEILKQLEVIEKRLDALEAKKGVKKEADNFTGDFVEFEGHTVKRYYGVFRCPFKCTGDNGYPERKWKTAKGFLGHKCKFSPSAMEARKVKRTPKERVDKTLSDYSPFLDARPEF